MAGPRVLPHDLELEKQVLGGVLVNNQAIHLIQEVGLKPEDFYRESHRKVFEVLSALSEKGEPMDLLTLSAGLRDRGWYDSVGGQDALVSLFEEGFGGGNLGSYAKRVREKAILRRMIEATGEISSAAMDPVEDLQEFLEHAERKVFSVMDSRLTKTFTPVSELLQDTIREIDEAAHRKEPLSGLATGFTELDRLTGGLRPGQMVVIAARPGMGKTSLVLSLVAYAAARQKAVVGFFSLEMSKGELALRTLSGMTRIPSRRLKMGKLQEREWTRLTHGCDQLSKSKIHFDDSGDLTVFDMRARCRRLKLVEGGLGLVVVDYLQLMRGLRPGKNETREREISEISRNLKALAKELGVPIIALSQLNRRVEHGQDKRPMLSDLRESGAIEQDADIVCFIYRDEVYNKESEERGVAELIVAKHRDGEPGTIRLAWVADCTLFANLAPDGPGAPVTPIRPDRGDLTV